MAPIPLPPFKSTRFLCCSRPPLITIPFPVNAVPCCHSSLHSNHRNLVPLQFCAIYFSFLFQVPSFLSQLPFCLGFVTIRSGFVPLPCLLFILSLPNFPLTYQPPVPLSIYYRLVSSLIRFRPPPPALLTFRSTALPSYVTVSIPYPLSSHSFRIFEICSHSFSFPVLHFFRLQCGKSVNDPV